MRASFLPEIYLSISTPTPKTTPAKSARPLRPLFGVPSLLRAEGRLLLLLVLLVVASTAAYILLLLLPLAILQHRLVNPPELDDQSYHYSFTARRTCRRRARSGGQ
jgi:hypothetical protein